MRNRFLPLLLVLSLSLAGCGTPGSAAQRPEDAGLSIVTTNFPGYDFARQVAGDHADVTMLLPPGAESHSFEPTPQDIIRIGDCDLFLYVGGESERWVDAILASLDPSERIILSMMEMVEVYEEEIVEGMQHGDHNKDAAYDEHVWTSPPNAVKIVDALCGTLSSLDPAHADGYRNRAADYTESLGELHAEFEDLIAASGRNLLVFGDRFPLRYFVETYGLDYYAAFPGCSSDTEPNPATIAFLIDKVRDESIPVVFYTEFSSMQMARAICDESGAAPLLFHSCHNVTADEFAGGVTYVDLMRANLANLREALG